MRQKILYMILAACLLLAKASSPEVSAEQPASKKLSEQSSASSVQRMEKLAFLINFTRQSL